MRPDSVIIEPNVFIPTGWLCFPKVKTTATLHQIESLPQTDCNSKEGHDAGKQRPHANGNPQGSTRESTH